MTPNEWPSLAPQSALSNHLFGTHGSKMLGTWFELQVDRLTDPAFARLFSDHIDLPDIEVSDYNHRLIRSAKGQLIGGIRFYGGDVSRPFVEIIAHDFQYLEALQDCVAAEWAGFSPLHLRIVLACGTKLPPFAHVDMTIYAGRIRDMPPPDNRVSLVPFDEVDCALSIATTRYAEVAKADLGLGRNISAADEADLKAWHENNQLCAIRAGLNEAETTVGLFAAAPGKVEWIEGEEVNEEVVLSAYSGHGYATSAQLAWVKRSGLDPSSLLIGTIDRLNLASRRSAEKAGRAALLDYVFVSL